MSTSKQSGMLRYLIPGFIFQSIVIGGGYGTGAEIAQYFGVNGLLGGLMGMVVTTIVWSLLCAVTFEFVRVFRTYDYNSMMGQLLGKAGFLYEVCYVVLLLIVLGVINATASSMFQTLTGMTGWIGIAILSVGIILLVIKGTEAIEKVLAFLAYVLYAVYLLFMIIIFTKFGGNVGAELAKGEIGSGWLMSGFQYSFYNLGIVPALLYTVRGATSRKDSVVSGMLAGVIGIIPAAMLLLAMSCNLPGAIAAEVPVTVMFEMLDMKWLFILFEIVLFGTLIETGTGFIKAVSDRIEMNFVARQGNAPAWVRSSVTAILVIVGIGVSTFGLVGLIAKGYGTICWGFFFIYVLPMLTIGVAKIAKHSK